MIENAMESELLARTTTFLPLLVVRYKKQDQGDLCRSPGFYFDIDFILRNFQDLETFQLVVP